MAIASWLHFQLTNLESLPDRTPEDQDSIDLLQKHISGGTKEHSGTLQNYVARMAAEGNPGLYLICDMQYHFELIHSQIVSTFPVTQLKSIFVLLAITG